MMRLCRLVGVWRADPFGRWVVGAHMCRTTAHALHARLLMQSLRCATAVDALSRPRDPCRATPRAHVYSSLVLYNSGGRRRRGGTRLQQIVPSRAQRPVRQWCPPHLCAHDVRMAASLHRAAMAAALLASPPGSVLTATVRPSYSLRGRSARHRGTTSHANASDAVIGCQERWRTRIGPAKDAVEKSRDSAQKQRPAALTLCTLSQTRLCLSVFSKTGDEQRCCHRHQPPFDLVC
jgi:hypothetical protein